MTTTVEETTDRRMPKTRREYTLTEPYRLPEGQENIYIAKSGIVVITCFRGNGTDDFRTIFHYMAWSHLNWGRKIWIPESWKGVHRFLRRLGDRLVSD